MCQAYSGSSQEWKFICDALSVSESPWVSFQFLWKIHHINDCSSKCANHPIHQCSLSMRTKPWSTLLEDDLRVTKSLCNILWSSEMLWKYQKSFERLWNSPDFPVPLLPSLGAAKVPGFPWGQPKFLSFPGGSQSPWESLRDFWLFPDDGIGLIRIMLPGLPHSCTVA